MNLFFPELNLNTNNEDGKEVVASLHGCQARVREFLRGAAQEVGHGTETVTEWDRLLAGMTVPQIEDIEKHVCMTFDILDGKPEFWQAQAKTFAI
ncbi:unnamed protein product [Amoebophrya sp. A120]|nr:unnamed protein product [Amoebophrya sp. A120]|eukprot:GSA120T00007567001.1